MNKLDLIKRIEAKTKQAQLLTERLKMSILLREEFNINEGTITVQKVKQGARKWVHLLVDNVLHIELSDKEYNERIAR
jgi:hypothetical protein